MRISLLCVVLISFFATTVHSQWIKQNVDTKASFRGLSVVSEKIVWASGTGGTVIRTIDRGKTWKVMTVPGAEKLDFRDIEAFDANTAYILSIGNGESSNVYKTIDGGRHWQKIFRNTTDKAFYDALGCFGPQTCLALSDPVDGQFLLRQIIVQAIGGGSNGRLAAQLPSAEPGEAAFAASGSCLITVGHDSVFIVSGGMSSRVFRSDDRGLTWKVTNSPMIKGTFGSGIFSIAMRDAKNGVIVGGNYEKPDEHERNLAFTTDGGQTWALGTGLSGYRSGVTYIDRKTIIAVGTNGTDISTDGGKTWKKVGDENLNAVQAKGNRAVWAAGPNGLVVKFKS